MRIAVAGAHAVGKTTLVNALADALPEHRIVEEPYHALTASGHVFGHPPAVEDFEAQWEWSVASVQDEGGNVIFDRCPADLFAYLAEEAPPDEVLARHWEATRQAMTGLDLVIHVPVERPDRIHVAADEFPGLRKRVDRRLRLWLEGDELVRSGRTRKVRGSVSQRVGSVLLAIAELKP